MFRDSDTSYLFFALKVTVTIVVFYNHFKVQAFVTKSPLYSSSSSSQIIHGTSYIHQPLYGVGMGMGATKSSLSKKKKKKDGKNKNKSKAFSSSASSSSSKSPFDVNASLIRLEKKYDELMLNAARELQKEGEEDSYYSSSSSTSTMMTSEYVVAARDYSQQGSVPDWVPIAQLCLKRPESEYHEGASDEMVQIAISVYCRELSHLAAVGAPVFSTIARNEIQYSVESVDSFQKFVYDEVVEGNKKKNPEQSITKNEARILLGLIKKDSATSTGTEEITKSDIKQAYRKMAFELHPDRFEGTPEECIEARNKFGRVKLAYDTLSSGVRGEEGISWYESLGGRERTGFFGPINLLPLRAAQEHMIRHNTEGACLPLDPTMVQSFVARHLRSS